MIDKNKEITCPPCTHNCREGRDCPSIAINAQIVGYVEPQRTWVGLTDEEIEQAYETTGHYQKLRLQDKFAVYALAKDIETKLKEKNL